ncbi:MAG: aminopeptidase P family N-terminal domain-containing protein, partial [Desulfuromonadales bacterium]|nr:aminopeptidase P family N-terminal domain-containing protein [Desulfuromonadales bacterium]
MIDLTELQQRTAAMQALLKKKELDGALFIYPIDVYYFSGTRQNATLWMPAEGTPVLLVRKSLARARQESPLPDIRPFPSSRDFAAVLPAEAVTLGLTYDVLPVQQLNFYTKLLAGREFVDISPLNREVRAVKTPFEVELLRRSG